METLTDIAGTLAAQMALLILIATFHGYGAAWLAVRMLFRPRKPFKVLGITLFPQGMIPRHRERLANAIGKAVGDELVSQETILEELLGKEFLRRKISDVVDSYSTQLTSQSYPSLVEALPASIRIPVLDSITSLQMKVAEHIEHVLSSPETRESVSLFVTRRLDDALSRRVSEVIDDLDMEKVVAFLDERIRGSLRSEPFEQKVREFIDGRVDDLMSTDTPLSRMFTDDAVSLLKEKAMEQISPVTHHLTEIAAAPRTRDQIGALIKKEVHEYYEGLPFFKKIFVSRENLLREVDDLVNESLPRRIEETLKGDFFAGEARSFIETGIDNALARPLREIVGTVDPAGLQSLKDQITRSVLSLIRSEAVTSQVTGYLRETIDRFRPHSIDSILRTLYPDSEEKLKAALVNGLMDVVARPETSRIINELLARQIDILLAAPIGRLSDHIAENKLVSARDSLTETIINAIQEKLPEAVKEFDVGGVVRQKIMTYPAEKLEELVLSVAKEHLRTIEFFGALFGFLIGVGQAIQFYIYSR